MSSPAEADTIGQKTIEVIARTQRIPVESVHLNSTFEELKIDSLDGINIVFELEKEFDIEIPDEGVAHLRSVEDTVHGVHELIAKKQASKKQAAEKQAAEKQAKIQPSEEL